MSTHASVHHISSGLQSLCKDKSLSLFLRSTALSWFAAVSWWLVVFPHWELPCLRTPCTSTSPRSLHHPAAHWVCLTSTSELLIRFCWRTVSEIFLEAHYATEPVTNSDLWKCFATEEKKKSFLSKPHFIFIKQVLASEGVSCICDVLLCRDHHHHRVFQGPCHLCPPTVYCWWWGRGGEPAALECHLLLLFLLCRQQHPSPAFSPQTSPPS